MNIKIKLKTKLIIINLQIDKLVKMYMKIKYISFIYSYLIIRKFIYIHIYFDVCLEIIFFIYPKILSLYENEGKTFLWFTKFKIILNNIYVELSFSLVYEIKTSINNLLLSLFCNRFYFNLTIE